MNASERVLAYSRGGGDGCRGFVYGEARACTADAGWDGVLREIPRQDIWEVLAWVGYGCDCV